VTPAQSRRAAVEAARAAIEAWLAGTEVEWEPGARPGEYVVQLPGEAKLRTTCSLVLGEHTLSAMAFVVRRPDENHEAFYRWLLARNLRLPGVAFALDRLGDVFLVGKLPVAAVTEENLDELLGSVLATADSGFNDLLALGFLSSMKREWAWRVERGESTRNLEPFRDLLEPGTTFGS
jgi:hypothetical protein